MNQLEQFCSKLKSCLVNRKESTTSMLYSLCNDTTSRSVVQLSLNSLYPYHYSCLGKSIDFLNFYEDKETKEIAVGAAAKNKILQEQLYADLLTPPKEVPYWSLNTDVTPIYREHSRCLSDRNYVKKNNVIKRKNGTVIGIGYEVSTVGINQRVENNGIGWNPPLSMLRVGSADNSVQFGGKQVRELVEGELFKLNEKLIVNNLDSGYFSLSYLEEIKESVTDYDRQDNQDVIEDLPKSSLLNLVSVIRIPSNRVVYRQVAYQAACNQEAGKSGAKTKYGDRFKLNEEPTHWESDSKDEFKWSSASGKTYKVEVSCWEDMIVRGENERTTYDKPFRLVRIQVFNPQTNELVFKRPMWLAVFGKRRKDLTLKQIHQNYGGRFDIEHFFSFGKKKLLLNSYQTCEVDHFDNWLLLVQLSYWMLYAGRTLGQNQYFPWEKYNQPKAQPNTEQGEQQPTVLTPIQTKRSFDRIISGFEQKPPTPKPRNNSSGRKKNESPGQRPRHKVRKKAEYRAMASAGVP